MHFPWLSSDRHYHHRSTHVPLHPVWQTPVARFSELIPLYLCSGVQCESGPRGFVPRSLSRRSTLCSRAQDHPSAANAAQTIVLKCDCNAEHTHQDPASDGLSPLLYSMACHRSRASLVACGPDPCGRPVDRPTDNRGAHPAPLAGLDSPHAVSRTLQIHLLFPRALGLSSIRPSASKVKSVETVRAFAWHRWFCSRLHISVVIDGIPS